jgi:predicted Zn finger-like uncharacterized protein
MKFVCNKCKTKYSIADEKVRRKVLKIRCKNCSNIIIVREPAARDATGQSRSGARPADRALEGAFRKRRGHSGVLAPLPASALVDEIQADETDFDPEPTRLSGMPDFLEDGPPLEDEWYLAVDGNQYGPMGFAELCSRVKRGEAGAEAFVWRDGFDEWMDLNQVPELRPFLPKHPPPPPRGRSGLYAVSALLPPVQPMPVGQSPVPASPYGPVKPPTAPSVPRVQAPLPPAQPIRPSSTPALSPVPEPLPQATPFPEPLPPAAPHQESGLGQLPPGPRLSAEAPALGPIVPSAAPARTPLWMVIAGIGGGLAALCGLFLVGYFLIFDRGERDREPRQVAMTTEQPPPPAAVAADAGVTNDNIDDFPPLEIARSAKPERVVRSRPRHSPPPSRPSGPKLTASQRRLMELYKDKGNPSAAAPTGKAAAKPSARRVISRRITPDELLTIQRRHGTELKACYERALKRDDSLTELKAEVTVTIGDTGVVRSVSVRAGNNPDLVACVKRSVKRWTFPAVGAQTFGFPIIFRGT